MHRLIVMELVQIICLFLAVISLLWMGWIDLKLWILPNELICLLALAALPFHFATGWMLGGVIFFVLGAVLGGGSLWIIRALGNRVYGFETMGLGDVKLMAAVGLWLGPQATLMALSVGAFAGVCHAAILAVKYKKPLGKMMLPAGPGFIVGALLVGIWTLKEIY